MNPNYENYLKVLAKRAKVAQEALDDWRKDGEDEYFASIISHFIGYCSAIEGFLEKDNKIEE